jgi:hypothetical protein
MATRRSPIGDRIPPTDRLAVTVRLIRTCSPTTPAMDPKSTENGVHSGPGGVIVLGPHVTVDVERHLSAGVAQTAWITFTLSSAATSTGGVEVPEKVEASPVGIPTGPAAFRQTSEKVVCFTGLPLPRINRRPSSPVPKTLTCSTRLQQAQRAPSIAASTPGVAQ